MEESNNIIIIDISITALKLHFCKSGFTILTDEPITQRL